MKEIKTHQTEAVEQSDSDESEKQLMTILPECKMPEKHFPSSIPNISEHVSNCTTVSKDAIIIETGLPCLDEFRYDEASDRLLAVNWCDYTAQDILSNEELLKTFQCRGKENGQLFLAQKIEESFSAKIFSQQESALIKKVLKAGLAKKIAPYDLVAAYKGPRERGKKDPDIQIMMEQWAFADEVGNEFIALTDYTKSSNYFYINGQVWNPFISDANWDEWSDTVWENENNKKSWNSHRYFGGFRGDVPLVKRMKHYRYLWSDEWANYSNYILETCKLKL